MEFKIRKSVNFSIGNFDNFGEWASDADCQAFDRSDLGIESLRSTRFAKVPGGSNAVLNAKP